MSNHNGPMIRNIDGAGETAGPTREDKPALLPR